MRDSILRRTGRTCLLLVPLAMSARARAPPRRSRGDGGKRAADPGQAVMPDYETPFQYFGGLELDPGISLAGRDPGIPDRG